MLHITNVTTSSMLTVLLAVSLSATGCEGDDVDDFGAGTPIMDRSSLIGSWTRGTDTSSNTMTFDGNGDFTDAYTAGDYSADTDEGRWSLNNSALSNTYDEFYEDTTYTEREREVESVYIAIIDNILYWEVFHRTSGNGGLDGTWELGWRDNATYEGREDGITYSESERVLSIATLTISGDTFALVEEVTWSESVTEGGERYSDSGRDTYESSGTVRLDGDTVYVTFTQDRGDPVPEEYRIETQTGWLLSDSVLSFGNEIALPNRGGYTRQ